jgi:Protein of unknown function (DUF3108)
MIDLRKNRFLISGAAIAVLCLSMFLFFPGEAFAQGLAKMTTAQAVQAPSSFRVGEKLTYSVSFGKFTNAAFVETSVVSRGRLSGQDAVELHSKVKTIDFVSAAFYQFDEDRTVFASPYSGLPIYVSRRLNRGPFPQETIGNYLTAPTTYLDALTLIYKARENGGSGSYSLFENENVYTVVFQPTISETVRTEAGEFATMVSTVQSDYLAANGIKDLKINFGTDEHHLPVLIRLKTSKGEFRISLLALQLSQPTVVTPPVIIETPGPAVTPKPKATATPYVDNMPLSPELGFDLGETLNYSVTSMGKPTAILTLKAVERKQVLNEDSLLLTATVTSVEQGSREFGLGDAAQVQVDPETLAPRQLSYKFAGAWKDLNQTVFFDRRSGMINFGAGKPVDAPIGTHTLLSLLYAMRSFNLRPSKDPNNPVNDTRVAVFLENQPYVFTLRPSNPVDIVVNGETISAQMVSINTGNERMDKQGLKVWLSVNNRAPVRFAYGQYEANLIPNVKTTP